MVVDAEGAEEAKGTTLPELALEKAGEGDAEGRRELRFTEVFIGLRTLSLLVSKLLTP